MMACWARRLPAAPGAQALYDACPGWGWSDAKKRAELADPAARYLVVFEQQAQQQQAQQAADGAAAAAPAAGGPAAPEGGAAGAAAPLTAAAAAATLEAPAAALPADEQRENSAAAGNSGGSGAHAAGGGEACLPGRPLAFVHFRFEVEEGEAVLYCYEIQVAAAAQVRPSGTEQRKGSPLLGCVACALPGGGVACSDGAAAGMLAVLHASVQAGPAAFPSPSALPRLPA